MTRLNKAGLAVTGVFLTLATTVGVMKVRGVPGQPAVAMSVPAVEQKPEPPKAAPVTPKPPEEPKADVKPPAPPPMPVVDVVAPISTPPAPLAGTPLKDISTTPAPEEEHAYVFQGPPAPEASGLQQMKGETPALPGVPGIAPPAPEGPPAGPIVTAPAIPQPGVGDLTPPAAGATPKTSVAPTPGVAPAPKIDPLPPVPPIIEAPSPTALPAVPGAAPLPPVDTPPMPVPAPPPVKPAAADPVIAPPPVKPVIADPILTPTPPAPSPSDVKPVPPAPMPPPPVPPPPPPAPTNNVPDVPVPAPVNPAPVKEPAEKTSSGTPLEGSRFVPAVTLSRPVASKTQPPTAGGPAPKIEVAPAGNQETVKPPVAPLDDLRPIAAPPPPAALPLKPVPPPASESRSTLPGSSLPSAQTNVVQIGGGVVSAAPATPRVTRVDTTSHVCQQQDTWESISKQHLISPNWADALRAYNMQSRFQNERIKQSGVFQPGDTVIIPPASVLEAGFPTLIRKDAR